MVRHPVPQALLLTKRRQGPWLPWGICFGVGGRGGERVIDRLEVTTGTRFFPIFFFEPRDLMTWKRDLVFSALARATKKKILVGLKMCTNAANDPDYFSKRN